MSQSRVTNPLPTIFLSHSLSLTILVLHVLQLFLYFSVCCFLHSFIPLSINHLLNIRLLIFSGNSARLNILLCNRLQSCSVSHLISFQSNVAWYPAQFICLVSFLNFIINLNYRVQIILFESSMHSTLFNHYIVW